METKEKRVRVFYSPETWHAVKVAACKGDTLGSLATKYGMTRQCISQRSKAENWPIPKRLKQKFREAANENLASPKKLSRGLESPALSVNNEQMQQSCVKGNPNNPGQLTKDLGNLSPADFQVALAGALESLLAQGIAEIQAVGVRSIRDVATLNDVIRKCRGMDTKGGQGGPVPLVDPARRLRRRAEVVEAEVVPETPEPGSAEWESWDV